MLRPLKDQTMTTTENLNTVVTTDGVVSGIPNLLLRAEGALVLAATTYAYSQQGFSWLMFALLFLVPDIFMVGFLSGNKLGAIIYNIGHTYLVPAAVLVVGWFLALPILVAIATIWIGHIGFDRILGFGLKYQTGFTFSHLAAPKK
jgi:hypothetical protein